MAKPRRSVTAIEPAQAGSIFVADDLARLAAFAAWYQNPDNIVSEPPAGRWEALPRLRCRHIKSASFLVSVMGFGRGTSGVAISVTLQRKANSGCSTVSGKIVDVISGDRIVEHLDHIACVLLEQPR